MRTDKQDEITYLFGRVVQKLRDALLVNDSLLEHLFAEQLGDELDVAQHAAALLLPNRGRILSGQALLLRDLTAALELLTALKTRSTPGETQRKAMNDRIQVTQLTDRQSNHVVKVNTYCS